MKTTLSLESLDRREVPASIARPPVGAESVRFEVPEGCWPGPVPVLDDAGIVVIGSHPASLVQGPDPIPWAGADLGGAIVVEASVQVQKV